jgi:hypothetical protein
LTAAALALTAAVLFAPGGMKRRVAAIAVVVMAVALGGQLSGSPASISATRRDTSAIVRCSRSGIPFAHRCTSGRVDNWSLSQTYNGPVPRTRYMDIDAAASTPILELSPDLSNVQFLRYELTAVAHRPAARVFGARDWLRRRARPRLGARVRRGHVDGVEINPIIANDVMRGEFKDFSGGIYRTRACESPWTTAAASRRGARDRYDIIQASLVDTWAATAVASTPHRKHALHRRSLRRLHRSPHRQRRPDDDAVGPGRAGWLVSHRAGGRPGAPLWNQKHLAIVQFDRVQTFMLKKSEFTRGEIATLRAAAKELEFNVIYAPTFDGEPAPALPVDWVDGMQTADYPRLIQAADRQQFYATYKQDIRPTTDDRSSSTPPSWRISFGGVRCDAVWQRAECC